MASGRLGGVRDKNTASTSLIYQPCELFQGRIAAEDIPGFAATTRHAWLTTEDQGVIPGQRSFRHASFIWPDPQGHKWTVLREHFPIAGTSAKALDDGETAQRVERAVDEATKADPTTMQPPEHLVWFRMAQYVSEPADKNSTITKLDKYFNSKTGQERKNRTRIYKTNWHKALDSLWRKQETWADVEEEWEQSPENIKKIVAILQAEYKPKSPTPFEQYDRDLKARGDHSILEYILDDVIYLLVDSEEKILVFRWQGALQCMYNDELVAKAAESFAKYVAHEPPKEPGLRRQAIDAHWARENPRFAKENAGQYPGASRGVYHFGFGEEQGHNRLKIKADSGGEPGSSRYENEKSDIRRIRAEMMHNGVIRAITAAHVLIQMILDPVLLKDQQKVMACFRDKQTRRVSKDPYSLTALLCDVLTTDHLDDDDWEGGLAMMSAFGEFTGGPLCLRQVGRQMSFGAGSIVAIRGHEIYHSIGWWEGAHRYSLVNVCQDSMKAWAALRANQVGQNIFRGTNGEEEVVPKGLTNSQRKRKAQPGSEPNPDLNPRKRSAAEMEGGTEVRLYTVEKARMGDRVIQVVVLDED